MDISQYSQTTEMNEAQVYTARINKDKSYKTLRSAKRGEKKDQCSMISFTQSIDMASWNQYRTEEGLLGAWSGWWLHKHLLYNYSLYLLYMLPYVSCISNVKGYIIRAYRKNKHTHTLFPPKGTHCHRLGCPQSCFMHTAQAYCMYV